MSLVAVIYCIVIIYLPSLIEAETNFVVSLMPSLSLLFLCLCFYRYLPSLSVSSLPDRGGDQLCGQLDAFLIFIFFVIISFIFIFIFTFIFPLYLSPPP